MVTVLLGAEWIKKQKGRFIESIRNWCLRGAVSDSEGNIYIVHIDTEHQEGF